MVVRMMRDVHAPPIRCQRNRSARPNVQRSVDEHNTEITQTFVAIAPGIAAELGALRSPSPAFPLRSEFTRDHHDQK